MASVRPEQRSASSLSAGTVFTAKAIRSTPGVFKSAWKAGNTDDARRWIAGILDQEGAPSDVATRARTVLDLLNAAEGTPDDKADS